MHSYSARDAWIVAATCTYKHSYSACDRGIVAAAKPNILEILATLPSKSLPHFHQASALTRQRQRYRRIRERSYPRSLIRISDKTVPPSTCAQALTDCHHAHPVKVVPWQDTPFSALRGWLAGPAGLWTKRQQKHQPATIAVRQSSVWRDNLF